MKLIFMGTGAFAVPSLRSLLASEHKVLALVTQPDKPAGRGHELRVPETKSVALERGVAVHQPPRVKAEAVVELVRSLSPDCIVVAAYGQIIPKSILDIPPFGVINVHGSLLPRYRGAAPIQWAIARGEIETGVTTMLMEEGLDTGPALLQRALPIEEEDTGGSLESKLAIVGAELLLETLSKWSGREIVPEPQDDSRATLAPRIKKEDGLVDWTQPARDIYRRVRAFNPWPVAYSLYQGSPLRIWKTRVLEEDDRDQPPGRILGLEGEGILIACGARSRLLVEEVQPAGKGRMSAAAFARGKRLAFGDTLASM